MGSPDNIEVLTEKKHGKATHGMSRTRSYFAWCGAIDRCHNERNARYSLYGGRGITVYQPWRDSYIDFHKYVSALPNFGLKGYSLDRINNDGNYEPGNLRWSTHSEQRRNTRVNRLITFNGKTQCLVEWAEELGTTDHTLQVRLSRGWSVERTLSTPVTKRNARSNSSIASNI